MSGRSLRIVFFGTPDFAVPTLDALLHSAHTVVGVVTRQDRPKGRGQKMSVTPVKARALAAGIPVLQPDRMNDAVFQADLNSLAADLGVVAAYGKILNETILATPRAGLINVHASLLPRYRGAAPVHRAIINGERETGVTIMRVVKALDAGPMLAAAGRPIGPDETSDELERDLARIGAPLLVSIVDAIASGPVTEARQDEAEATYAHRLSRDDGAIDWTRPAGAIHNLIRGLHPWPHAFTFHQGHRLILLRSHPLQARDPQTSGVQASGPDAAGHHGTVSVPAVDPRGTDGIGEAPPGTIVAAKGDQLHVATGDGILAIAELQAEGRRPMTAREFLAGSKLAPGASWTKGA